MTALAPALAAPAFDPHAIVTDLQNLVAGGTEKIHGNFDPSLSPHNS